MAQFATKIIGGAHGTVEHGVGGIACRQHTRQLHTRQPADVAQASGESKYLPTRAANEPKYNRMQCIKKISRKRQLKQVGVKWLSYLPYILEVQGLWPRRGV